jgi:hypothetical protein
MRFEHGVRYFVDYERDAEGNENGQVKRLFFTFEHCLQMWKKHPDILLFDNTYKVCACIGFVLFSSQN